MNNREADDVLLERALKDVVDREMSGARGVRLRAATTAMVRPMVELALADVLERRYMLVEELLEHVALRNEKDDPKSDDPDARYRAGYEGGLAWAALWFGVDAAASPQRRTELPAWLEAHKSEDR